MSGAILVIGPAWVGDMVMAQSLFALLAERHPGVAVDVVAPPFTLPLLARMPQVRRAIPLATAHGELALGKRWRLAKSLRPAAYDQAIVLPGSFKSALLPFLARIPRRTGFLGEGRWFLLNDLRPLDKDRLLRTVDRFVTLGLEAGEPLPDPFPLPAFSTRSELLPPLLDKLGLTRGDTPLLILCPGAEYGPAKQWPVYHFATLARAMGRLGWRVWVVGSGKEREAGELIAREGGASCHNLAGHTTLEEALDLLASASAVVTNDSGLMHVAAALNRRVIALFGSSDPRHTPPLGRFCRTVFLDLPCAPCFQRTCPIAEIAPCLDEITPDHVQSLLVAPEWS